MAGPLAGRVHLTFAEFALVLAAMTIAYLGVIVFGTHVRARWILGAIALVHVAFVVAPPLLSTDVYNYIVYARLGVLHGLDPYSHGAVAVPGDPSSLLAAWRATPSAYGPLFTLGSYPLAYLSVPAAVWAFKLLAGAASLGCVALVWKIAEQVGLRPVTAAAVFGLNPMLLIWTVGGAHNDLLMLALLLGGVSLVLAAKPALGAGAVVAAAAVKTTAGLAIPFLLLGARRRWRAVAGLAAGTAAVALVTAVAFPSQVLGVFRVLNHLQDRQLAYFSVPTETARLVGLHAHLYWLRPVGTALLLAALLWLGWWVRRSGDWVTACGWAFVAVVVTSAWFLAWYTVWALPFAALSRDRRLLVAVVALQVFFVVNHVPQLTV
jgi:alpha-1,6-mannosyltransferase